MNASKAVLLTIISVLVLASTALVLPFLQYFLLAVLLAYVLYPLQGRLAPRTSPRIAAGILVLAATTTVILPLVLVVRTIAAEAASMVRQIRNGNLTFDVFEGPLRRFTGINIDISSALRSAISDGGLGAFDSVIGIFEVVTHAIIGLGLTLFLLYYFLKDGDQLWRWFRRTVPLPKHVHDDLRERIDDIAGGVLLGHVLVALVQGVIAGIGLAIVEIPNVLFWTAMMVVLALLPIIGSFLVWGPAAIYLVSAGRPLAGLFLFGYGVIIVGVSDDYLRPVVVDRYAKINPGVIILGVLGGVYVIGFMGIFYGPIVIGALRAALDVYREEYAPVSV